MKTAKPTKTVTIEKTCATCGKVFYAQRPRAAYCSDPCKMKAYRRRRRRRQVVDVVAQEMTA